MKNTLLQTDINNELYDSIIIYLLETPSNIRTKMEIRKKFKLKCNELENAIIGLSTLAPIYDCENGKSIGILK